MRYFEDFKVGERFDCGSRSVSEAELIAFAHAYDPQPFHLDAAAAAASPLQGLALSGWHTASIMMRLYYEGALRASASLGAPGLNQLRWSAPARPDTPIHVTLDVLAKRESRSRPEIGFVSLEAIGVQDGVEVCRFDFPAMIKRRGQEDAAMRVADRRAADSADLFAEARAPEEMGFTRAEDMPFGALFDLGEATFASDEIIDFASKFDPQPFHLSEEGGRASAFGGLAASGWQICSLWMRSFVLSGQKAAAAAATSEDAAAMGRLFGPSPGFELLKWRLPALAGDRFRFFARPLRLEETPRRPEWALLVAENGAVNQFDALAFSFTSKMMIRREATAP